MRTLVKAGTVSEGDTIRGKTVTGLGRSWIAKDEHLCAIGEEPGSKVRVQYAYLKDARAERIAELEHDLKYARMYLDRLSKPKRKARLAKIERLENELAELKG